MNIEISYDSSVNSAPAAFKTDINIAVDYLECLFSNPATITIDVGYGEVDGQTMGPGALGESVANYTTESYSAVRSALIAEGAPGSSTLPAASPFSGSLAMSQAEAKALGFSTAGFSSVDGYVGFSKTAPFSYGNGTTPPANEYYFIGVVEHEITEDMGRVSWLNYQPKYYALIDMYRYSSPGVRDLSTGGPGSTAYFSINNGTTNLGTWNNNPKNGDLADWYGNNIPNQGHDAFNDYSSPGVINSVSQTDVTLMEAIGWTTHDAMVTGNNFSVRQFKTTPLGAHLTRSGSNIAEYGFYDAGGTGNGYLTMNGVAQPDGQWIYVTPGQLRSVGYYGGSTVGQQTLYVEHLDGVTGAWSGTHSFTATTAYAPAHYANVGLLSQYAASSFAPTSTGYGGHAITDSVITSPTLLAQPHA